MQKCVKKKTSAGQATLKLSNEWQKQPLARRLDKKYWSLIGHRNLRHRILKRSGTSPIRLPSHGLICCRTDSAAWVKEPGWDPANNS